MNLTEIRKIASELKITGRSKMNKADLIIAIGDACYDEATAENRSRVCRTIAQGAVRKSYTERMLNRVQGYYAQNGCAKLTAKQQRRVDKKYRKQYGNLLSSLV